MAGPGGTSEIIQTTLKNEKNESFKNFNFSKCPVHTKYTGHFITTGNICVSCRQQGISFPELFQ
jgi:hypothetical protein